MDAPISQVGRALPWISAPFALAYFAVGLGLELPYPVDVIIKAAGIVTLSIYAAWCRRPALAIALALGSIGDVLLALRPAQMTLGIAAFGAGHLIYLGLFAGIARREGARGLGGWIGAGLLALFGVAMLLYLQPHFGQLRVAASVYNGIIVAMACVAVAGRSPTLAWLGALAFVASDTLLALRLFADMLPWAGPVVWLSYYAAQLGLALGLDSTNRTSDPLASS